MKFQYHLELEDFLTHQLYQASTSKRIRNKRRRNWLLPSALYLLSSLAFLFGQSIPYALTFGALALVWFLLYPLYNRWLYKNHYRKHLEEKYTHRIGVPGSIEVSGNELILEDKVSESRISLKAFQGIVELPELILLKIDEGQSFLLPKNRLAASDLESFLGAIQEETGLKIQDQSQWVWK